MKVKQLLPEATIAQHDEWSRQDVAKEAKSLVNRSVKRWGALPTDEMIRKIKAGWSGLNPAVVNQAIKLIKKDADTTPQEK